MKSFKIKSLAFLFLTFVLMINLLTSCTTEPKSEPNKKPNIIVIFADDMGYGDVGIYGHPTIKTPNIDRMAVEGQKWTNYYVASSLCSPSRAALLTGRLPIRTGITQVLFPNSEKGLPQTEKTIADFLKENGYNTAMVGKWHLGDKSPFLPTDHGFDSYFGIPYSNDMDRIEEFGKKGWIDSQISWADQENFKAYNFPLLRDDKIIERPVDQRSITKRYTKEAIDKISEFRNNPFYINLAYTMPHIPLFRSEEFKDVSLAGIYGDVIEEIDWSVGQVLNALKKEGLYKNTLVVFTSDNGPWHIYKTHAGSAGLFQGAKGGTFEGGFRVPTIFSWPEKIKSGVITDMGSTMDLLPTFCALTDTKLPTDRIFDGYDISPVLLGTGVSPRDEIYYYRGDKVYAVRKGKYKAHFITQLSWDKSRTSRFVTDPEIDISEKPKMLETPLLYNVNVDPAERYNIADKHPEVIEAFKNLLIDHQKNINHQINKK